MGKEMQINLFAEETRLERLSKLGDSLSMHGLTLRSIGLSRARFNIGLTNLVYNLCRFAM